VAMSSALKFIKAVEYQPPQFEAGKRERCRIVFKFANCTGTLASAAKFKRKEYAVQVAPLRVLQ